MDHSLYRPEDFACDESYLRYYFRLNEKDTDYWEHWIRTHPEKLDIIMSADQLIGFLSLQLPEEEFQHEYDRFTRAIAKAASQDATRVPVRQRVDIIPAGKKERSGRRTGLWLMLITVLLVAGSTYLFEYHKGTHTASAAPASDDMIYKKNMTAAVMDITLEDSTRVVLEPGASLSWPVHFPPGKRETVLDGAAFFSAGRNDRRPFLVYCNKLVTHVLGTGFFNISGKQDDTTEVSVTSGKVEVYEKSDKAPRGDFPQKAGNGIVLTPNQKLIYTGGSGLFETTLVDNPFPVNGWPGGDSLATGPLRPGDEAAFHNTRLSAIVQSLEKLYGINIDVENEAIYNCRFSGSLVHMNLYDKLNTICHSLHTTYEIKGTTILIRGTGCDPK